jgi:hypothetical protein
VNITPEDLLPDKRLVTKTHTTLTKQNKNSTGTQTTKLQQPIHIVLIAPKVAKLTQTQDQNTDEDYLILFSNTDRSTTHTTQVSSRLSVRLQRSQRKVSSSLHLHHIWLFLQRSSKCMTLI